MAGKTEMLPMLLFQTERQLEEWLEAHHASMPGTRMQIAKKGSGIESITYQEALDIALCYGWIDSRKEKYDDASWIQVFTPRGAKSIWSKVNKEKAERLIEHGRMKASGLAAIEKAKRNGEWDKAYESQSIAGIPADFAEALDRSKAAKAFYDTLDRANKYAMTFRIHNAKKPETRVKRIAQFVDMLEKGEKIYP
ncbi:YdeI/OmpD-associated family protein [Paenibacillus glycinis]|uniref:Bacteriocin-protection protein n=1 Tax=Paenibacillus glycinis TaxID=2697035 RepID=A0ABW9XKZ8_9BACL|nr:YdeI/OmpD-associated family protein [Paenibacillus glycinis]NBD23281.1 bacteriocin-protection protein [Paenibacillus glycinis]